MATIVLVPGAWLGAWAWREVTDGLRGAGHQVFPLTLTGVADRSHLAGPGVDLDTHATDIVRLVEVEELTGVVLVGHSHGGIAVAAAADRIADRLARVVYVDSGPLPDGMAEIDIWPAEEQARVRANTGPDGRFPPRAWDPAADPVTLAGLDEAALAELRARATPHPAGSVTQPMAQAGKPYGGPVTLVSCTIPLDQALAMRDAGHPYFALLADADIVGLSTGHWPMFSEPARLTGILDGIARR